MASRRWLNYAFAVILLHGLAIALLLPAGIHHPILLGMALLSYTFGLRHGFDVDHIAAIDNTVRKLVQQGGSSLGVGFYFSLGHSTVVACMTLITVLAVRFTEQQFPTLQYLGAVIGTVISGAFLIVIGLINLLIWLGIYRVFRRIRIEPVHDAKIEELLHARGFLTRILNPLFKMVTKSWHVYPIGFLFGLGFDTASEVALLAVSAMAARNAVPVPGILALPVVFAAGMSLIDTGDGILMTTAYGWAFTFPLHKVYYNLTVTGLGVLAALLIGCIELGQVISQEMGLHGGLWGWIQGIRLGNLGYVLVAALVLVWAVSFALWKWLRIGERVGVVGNEVE